MSQAPLDWIEVSSSMVHSYAAPPGWLVVRFRDPKTRGVRGQATYEDPGGSLARGMAAAPSKGKFVHERLWNLPYI